MRSLITVRINKAGSLNENSYSRLYKTASRSSCYRARAQDPQGLKCLFPFLTLHLLKIYHGWNARLFTSLLPPQWTALKSYHPLLPNEEFCSNSRITARECELWGGGGKYFQSSIFILPISYLSWLHWILWNEKQGQKVRLLYPILVSQLRVPERLWELPL